jgi:hypothetical protein
MKMIMTRNEERHEVTVEKMFGRNDEYSVYPFCITMSALEDLGFRFEAAIAKAA